MFHVRYFGCFFLFKMHVNFFSYMVYDISVHVDFKRYISASGMGPRVGPVVSN